MGPVLEQVYPSSGGWEWLLSHLDLTFRWLALTVCYLFLMAPWSSQFRSATLEWRVSALKLILVAHKKKCMLPYGLMHGSFILAV